MVVTSSSSSASCASFNSFDDVTKSCCSVKFVCSYGGRILPRYPDGRLRYVGGETRVISVNRSLPFSEIQVKLGELCGWDTVNLRCQHPTEDLDALVSITSDDDLANLLEEYDLVRHDQQYPLKIRAFLHRSPSKSPKSATPPETPVSPLALEGKPSFPHPIHAAVDRCVNQIPSPMRYPIRHVRSFGDLRVRGCPTNGCPAPRRYPLVHHDDH